MWRIESLASQAVALAQREVTVDGRLNPTIEYSYAHTATDGIGLGGVAQVTNYWFVRKKRTFDCFLSSCSEAKLRLRDR